MQNKMIKLRNKKGFTLMEMLIVVAIIAILIAIAIPTFNGALKKAEDGTDLANARSLYAAVQLSEMTDGSLTYPAAGAATITFDGTTYTFNTAPTIVSNDTTWSITTVPQNATATPAQTFTVHL